MTANGRWQITRNSDLADPVVLARGNVAAIRPETWHAISFGLHRNVLTLSIDGKQVGRIMSARWRAGLAGIGSNWSLVQFKGLTVG